MTQGWATAPEAAPETTATCTICGHVGPAWGDAADRVTMGPIRWRDPLPGKVFDVGRRCADHKACRERCEAVGDLWPIEDGTPPTRPAALPEPVEPAADDDLDFGA